MQPGNSYLLTEDAVDEVINGLRVAGMVNITWGTERGMLCGNPLAMDAPLAVVVCHNEKEAWAINRAKEAIGNGDEAEARRQLAPLVKPARRH